MSLEITTWPPARSICFFNFFSFAFIPTSFSEAPSECCQAQIFYTAWSLPGAIESMRQRMPTRGQTMLRRKGR